MRTGCLHSGGRDGNVSLVHCSVTGAYLFTVVLNTSI